MGANRYILGTSTPRPTMKIPPSVTDILHVLKMGERIDTLAGRYYKDQTEGWIIMCANPEWDNEFEILPGTEIRIPFPKQRVFSLWMISNEM